VSNRKLPQTTKIFFVSPRIFFKELKSLAKFSVSTQKLLQKIMNCCLSCVSCCSVIFGQGCSDCQTVYCVRLLYDLNKSPPDTNAQLKNKRKIFCTKDEQRLSGRCGLWFKSNLNDKEHFYCRSNAGKIAGQYGT